MSPSRDSDSRASRSPKAPSMAVWAAARFPNRNGKSKAPKAGAALASMKLQTAMRIPIVLAVILALFAAMWAALVRVGWKLPTLPTPIAGQHGALMISAFLGTLISLERAVALHKKWAYLAPILSALGGLALLLGLPPEVGRGLIALGSLG